MSRFFPRRWLMAGVAQWMIGQAVREPTYDGLDTEWNRRLINRCSGFHSGTGTKLIFTRDAGMHSSGWWKNPDYERCWHLSLSFVAPLSGEPLPKDVRLTDAWLQAFFGEACRYIWSESPKSDEGKVCDVWHYRVFCNPAWHPIIPRGEVYSREHTEAGWLSFSDLQNAHATALAQLTPHPGEQ